MKEPVAFIEFLPRTTKSFAPSFGMENLTKFRAIGYLREPVKIDEATHVGRSSFYSLWRIRDSFLLRVRERYQRLTELSL